MVCTYNSVFFSHSKEWSSGTSLHDEPWKRYAKRNKLKPQRTNIMWLHLYEISRIDKSIDKKFRLVASGGYRDKGIGRNCLIDNGFYFGMMEMFWNYRKGYTTLWMD